VTVVVDLTAEFPVNRRILGERGYLCLPTLDAHVPDDQALASLVDRALERGGVLYVHCAYGHGRSALVAAAMLLRRGEAAGPDEAIARLKAARPRVKLSPSQRAALGRLARR
jgi:protein-tyrosine phosphatase